MQLYLCTDRRVTTDHVTSLTHLYLNDVDFYSYIPASDMQIESDVFAILDANPGLTHVGLNGIACVSYWTVSCE